MNDDLDDMMESDKELVEDAFRDWQRSDGFEWPNPGKLLEGVLWGLAVVSLIGMVVAIPWVGPNKLIPGNVWILYGCMGIVFFGGGAFLFRLVRGQFAEDVNTNVSNRLEGGR
jgi:hypothetical protein